MAEHQIHRAAYHQAVPGFRPFAIEGGRALAGQRGGRAAKRALDVFGSVVGIVMLSPVMLVISALIRLESPGPALFKQTRIGRGGEPFTLYKLRTMSLNNDEEIHERYVRSLITDADESLKGESGCYKLEDDPRVTRIGRFLRRTSLDELPQLLNVFLGDMSLVGPRPPMAFEVELYSPRARRRLDGLPGMTGLWQVSGRCETTFDEMVELDIRYLENQSFAGDIKILMRTVPVVFGKRGAC